MSELEAARIDGDEYDRLQELRTPTDELRIAGSYSLYIHRRAPDQAATVHGSPGTGYMPLPITESSLDLAHRYYRLDAIIEDVEPGRLRLPTRVTFNLAKPGGQGYWQERRRFWSDGTMVPQLMPFVGVVALGAYFYRPPETDDDQLHVSSGADSEGLSVPV